MPPARGREILAAVSLIPAEVARNALVFIFNGMEPEQALWQAAVDHGLPGAEIAVGQDYGIVIKYPRIIEDN